MNSADDALPGIRVIVVDDEPLARRNLILLLKRVSGLAEIAECSSGAEAVEAVRREQPDLMFLDVQMPEVDGFDVLELLGGEAPPVVVFVTAHDEYAVRAFEAGALDYLMKPFDDARFHRALARAKEQLVHAHSARRTVERLVVKSRGRAVFLNVGEIDWIEADSYYACLHVGRETHVLRRTLAELELDLDSRRFLRIHRSAIVNLERVTGFELDELGEHQLVLENGVRHRVSRRYRKALQKRMDAMSHKSPMKPAAG
jgi:two-component system LytT family response regulator